MELGGLEIGGIFGGIATAISGVFSAVMKARTDRALKQIEISATWQQQMLSRIGVLEQQLEEERTRASVGATYYTRRIEGLRHEHVKLRRDYEHLKAANEVLESETWQARERMSALDHRNTELELHNLTLRNELRDIHDQVQDLRTIPPMLILKGKDA